ncbi:MAG: polysaccharide deacetylase family protein [Clostridiales bacterium]|jgi:peptidoglycan/xylan/chitin deacetylase (PgdA/CDA1 family)|nr:polysaccharide deacetylase family protein [Clostridiales bacterium]
MYRFFCILFCVAFLGLPTANTAEERPQGVPLPILMYHAVLPDCTRRIPYSVHICDLARDLDLILREGYTSVTLAALTAFARGEADLPEKPILLTFDDGFYSMKSLVLPALERRGMHGVAAVVGRFAETLASHNDVYGYLSYADMSDMEKTGVIEIANHTNDMHALSARRGVAKKRGESAAAYERALKADVGGLNEKLARHGIHPAAFAYPFGITEKNTTQYLKDLGFSVTLGCREKTNYLRKGDPACLFNMRRYNRDKKDAAEILKRAGR